MFMIDFNALQWEIIQNIYSLLKTTLSEDYSMFIHVIRDLTSQVKLYSHEGP